MVELPDHPHFIGCQFILNSSRSRWSRIRYSKDIRGRSLRTRLKRRAEKAASEIEDVPPAREK